MTIETIKVLDHGYVKYIGHMGSDESFVEAARMSTGKGFFGWVWERDTYADALCPTCFTQHLRETLPENDLSEAVCTNCWLPGVIYYAVSNEWKVLGYDIPEEYLEPKLLGKKGAPRDIGLLTTLYSNRHQTPFEMGELCIEVAAPIMVFREWHRHRTQSYNEFSARYSQMPNTHYVPNMGRIQKQSTSNKQGSGEAMPKDFAASVCGELRHEQQSIYDRYDDLVRVGVAKEVARINTPVSRYSKMRAKTDIRNWLAFMTLRMNTGAQWEIRQYANAVASIIKQLFPRTYELFLEYDLLGTNFSRSEMRALRELFLQLTSADPISMPLTKALEQQGLGPRVVQALVNKITQNKEAIYKDSI